MATDALKTNAVHKPITNAYIHAAAVIAKLARFLGVGLSSRRGVKIQK
jgi:hypothetical protein